MKRLLFGCLLLMTISISGTENFKFRFASSDEDLTSIMQMAIKRYNGVTNNVATISDEEKEKIKIYQGHCFGYLHAMINSGNKDWMLVHIYDHNDEQLGFFSFRRVQELPDTLIIYLTPTFSNGYALFPAIMSEIMDFMQKEFPENRAFVLTLSQRVIATTPLLGIVENLGFKEWDGYELAGQFCWIKGFVTFRRLVEEER